MNKIKEVFDATFDVPLPEEALRTKQTMFFDSPKGWELQICFGIEDGRGYMDYYASHNMTNDRHCRIYEDGEVKRLEALSGWRLRSDDPVEDKKLEEEFHAYEHRIREELQRKGFTFQTPNQTLSWDVPAKPPTTSGSDKKTVYQIWWKDDFDYQNVETECSAIYASEEEAKKDLQGWREEEGERSRIKFWMEKADMTPDEIRAFCHKHCIENVPDGLFPEGKFQPAATATPVAQRAKAPNPASKTSTVEWILSGVFFVLAGLYGLGMSFYENPSKGVNYGRSLAGMVFIALGIVILVMVNKNTAKKRTVYPENRDSGLSGTGCQPVILQRTSQCMPNPRAGSPCHDKANRGFQVYQIWWEDDIGDPALDKWCSAIYTDREEAERAFRRCQVRKRNTPSNFAELVMRQAEMTRGEIRAFCREQGIKEPEI